MSVLLNRVESSGDGGNVAKRWLNDMTEEPSVTCLPVVHRPPLSRAHGVHVVGDERGQAHRIRDCSRRTEARGQRGKRWRRRSGRSLLAVFMDSMPACSAAGVPCTMQTEGT